MSEGAASNQGCLSLRSQRAGSPTARFISVDFLYIRTYRAVRVTAMAAANLFHVNIGRPLRFGLRSPPRQTCFELFQGRTRRATPICTEQCQLGSCLRRTCEARDAPARTADSRAPAETDRSDTSANCLKPRASVERPLGSLAVLDAARQVHNPAPSAFRILMDQGGHVHPDPLAGLVLTSRSKSGIGAWCAAQSRT